MLIKQNDKIFNDVSSLKEMKNLVIPCDLQRDNPDQIFILLLYCIL